jgi:hypothetical protein
LFVAADAGLGALDVETGRLTWRTRIPMEEGFTVHGATFDVEGFTAPRSDAGPPETLAHALASVVWDPDHRFGDVKLYAINELARLEGRDVTAELLRALETTDMPPAVLQRAVDALVDRRDPASIELYEAALRVRSDYAEDRHAPRVDVLARVVAVAKAKQAMPALIEHLRLPETDPVAVRPIADAALATRAREAVPTFLDYLLEYRADPAFGRNPEALLAAAEVVVEMGGPSQRATLLFVADDPRTVDPLKTYLRRVLFSQ